MLEVIQFLFPHFFQCSYVILIFQVKLESFIAVVFHSGSPTPYFSMLLLLSRFSHV